MIDADEPFNIVTKVQLSGILLKKSFSPHSNKWNKRFFMVKEGFLLYYSENEKKSFDKRGYFNIHPKGVLPIGGCIIQPSSDVGQEYIIKIGSDSFINGPVILAAETQFDQERWIQGLQEAARITWENSRMGESIIRDLESQGLKLNKEKQSYVEKLHEETIALQDEIDRNEELEKLNLILDEEKCRLQETIAEFKKEHEAMKREYEETISALRLVQQDKEALEQTTSDLMKNLADLEEEKLRIHEHLNRKDTNCYGEEKATEKLHEDLQDIEEETRCLLEEKTEIEIRYQENELRAKLLEEEKQLISEESSKLLSSLNVCFQLDTMYVIQDLIERDLLTQKDLPESDLLLEMSARIDAEKQLKLAQDSVYKLEGALETEINPLELRTKILPDVKKLRQFFEHVAEEAKIDANMPVIMKNAVYARKKLAKKARSQVIEQSRQEKAKTLGLNFEDSPSADQPLRRSLSIMISKNSLKPQLTRSKSLRMNNGALNGSQRIYDE
ncbi:pleckstrin homology domain-containing family D member 1-like isoform X2 [Schistocerca americana]|uniref:pleckstrin homology domain-containing family D member 1-like isoform X2 n=1 Tax=Schistocerca americana TaxID=7009 RepID=UPI001F4F655C|nr:pleckstrin homology domain-containing family D member 1-like isoform X2 [Schistocerca americana]